MLVGAGTTSFAAAKAIREKDPKSKVRLYRMKEAMDLVKGSLDQTFPCFFCVGIDHRRGRLHSLQSASSVQAAVAV